MGGWVDFKPQHWAAEQESCPSSLTKQKEVRNRPTFEQQNSFPKKTGWARLKKHR